MILQFLLELLLCMTLVFLPLHDGRLLTSESKSGTILAATFTVREEPVLYRLLSKGCFILHIPEHQTSSLQDKYLYLILNTRSLQPDICMLQQSEWAIEECHKTACSGQDR